MKDILYVDLVRFVSSESGDNALSPAKLSERRSIGINIQGRPGNGGEAKVVLWWGDLMGGTTFSRAIQDVVSYSCSV